MAAIQYIDRANAARMNPHTRTLARAAIAALTAPSIFNSQPWCWRVGAEAAHLRADRRRHITPIDPDGRLLTVSCGVALHHARIALAAAGAPAEVMYLPDPDDQDLLATVRLGHPAAPEGQALRLYRAMSARHTDRRPFADRPVPPGELEHLRAAATAYGASLDFPDNADLITVTVAAGHAARAQTADPTYRAELATWRRRAEHGDDGVPAATVPALAARPVPVRDFAAGDDPGTRHEPLLVGDLHARYGVLSTIDDGPRDWLAAGEALSAVLLTATAHGLATSPMSDLVEVPASRQILRDILPGSGHPAIVVRIGIPSTGGFTATGTPRRTPADAIDMASEHPTAPEGSIS